MAKGKGETVASKPFAFRREPVCHAHHFGEGEGKGPDRAESEGSAADDGPAEGIPVQHSSGRGPAVSRPFRGGRRRGPRGRQPRGLEGAFRGKQPGLRTGDSDEHRAMRVSQHARPGRRGPGDRGDRMPVGKGPEASRAPGGILRHHLCRPALRGGCGRRGPPADPVPRSARAGGSRRRPAFGPG